MAHKLPSEKAIEAVKRYRKKGWHPFPLPIGQKKPDPKKGWKKVEVTVTDDNIEDLWSNGENIGVVLENPLTDIDLDCDETVAVAPRFLPPTAFKFGRNGPGLTHFVYECPDAEYTTFVDPVAQKKNQNGAEEDAMLVEIRTGEMYSMFPPSVHPSGHQLKFGPKAGFPEAILFPDLKARVSIVAAVAIMVRYWPTTGGRNEATMALCGGLVRNERDNKIDPDLVEKIVECIVEEGGNSDPRSDFLALERTRKTFEKIEAGADKKVKGWTSLSKLLGSDGKTVIQLFRKWLGILPKSKKRPASPLFDTPWADKLIVEVTSRGDRLVSRIADNVSTVLRHDPAFHVADDEDAEEVTEDHEPLIYYDEFRRCKMIRDPLPWDHMRNWHKKYPRQWEDVDVIALQGYMARQWGLIIGPTVLFDGVNAHAAENYQHEIKQYLQELV